MPCGHTARSKCLLCTHTPAAIAARAQLSGLTIHASAAKPRYFDIAATAHQIRLKASRSSYGLQLHGPHFDATVALLQGQDNATVNELLGQANLNTETRVALKHALGHRR